MTPTELSPEQAVALLKPGMRVFIQGMGNEPLAFRAALESAPHRADGVTFIGVMVPGFNDFDYAGLHPGARGLGMFVSPAVRKSFEAGRFEHLPISYAGMDLWLRQSEPLDLAVLQCAPPDASGRCSFGLNADFGAVAAARSRAVIAQVNPQFPVNPHDEGVRFDALAGIIRQATPLPLTPSGAGDPQLDLVAGHAAALVRDGDTIQIGIGKVQAAIMRRLGDRNDLGLHSGVLSDEVAALITGGQMTGAAKAIDCGLAVTMAAGGTAPTHAIMADPRVALRPAAYTHAARILLQLPNLVCLNSALEVDLFGQVNGESANGRLVSGTGGAGDFTGAARFMPGARAVIALPAATPSGKSRIVPLLALPPSLRRADADVVVTEHGVAKLRDLTLDGRADALIQIAAPAQRDALREAWRDLRKRL
jgi:acyl-CoA hydrolase